MDDCIISNNCTNKNKLCANDMSSYKLANLIEIITKMYLEREKEVIAFDYMVCNIYKQVLFYLLIIFLKIIALLA